MTEMHHARLVMLEKFVDRLVFLGTKWTRIDVIGFLESACRSVGVGASNINVTEDPVMYAWGISFVLKNTDNVKRYVYIKDVYDDKNCFVGYNMFCVKDRSDDFAPAWIPLLDNGEDHVAVISKMIGKSFTR
jgi:hypothetical protein